MSRAARAPSSNDHEFSDRKNAEGAFPCPSSLAPFCFFLDNSRGGSRSGVAGFLIASQIRFLSVSSVLRESLMQKDHRTYVIISFVFNMPHVCEMILDSSRIFHATEIDVSCHVIVVKSNC